MYQLQRKAKGMNSTFWIWVGESPDKNILEKLKYGTEEYRYRKLKYKIEAKHSPYASYKWIEGSFEDWETAYKELLELEKTSDKCYQIKRVWRVVK